MQKVKRHTRFDSETGRSTDTESIKRLCRSFLTVGGSDVERECATRTTVDLIDLIYKGLCDEVAVRARKLKGTDVKAAFREAERDGRIVADVHYCRLREEPEAWTAPVLPQVYYENEELRREVKNGCRTRW